MPRNDRRRALLEERKGHKGSTFDEGRLAYSQHGDERKCPHSDAALREAWTRGFREAKAEAEKN